MCSWLTMFIFFVVACKARSKLCVNRCEITDAEDIGLGLILDVGGNHATVAYVRPHGLLDRWNRRCQSVREQFYFFRLVDCT